MVKLVTVYWESLVKGEGDAKGRAVLGDSLVISESETVMNNRRARDLRTFPFKERSIVMESHLRIGIKPSKAETWRLHFYWDAEERKIVVGHCGEHLDHK
jgi:hypothetical protein